jgi:hypothetical protein
LHRRHDDVCRKRLADDDRFLDHHGGGRGRLLLDIGNDLARRRIDNGTGDTAGHTANGSTHGAADDCAGDGTTGCTGHGSISERIGCK